MIANGIHPLKQHLPIRPLAAARLTPKTRIAFQNNPLLPFSFKRNCSSKNLLGGLESKIKNDVRPCGDIASLRPFKRHCSSTVWLGGLDATIKNDLHPDIAELLQRNHEWAHSMTEKDKDFFQNLAKGQKPKILFIGCSDSRVPAETMTGCSPGELFVHRNVANLVVNTDTNAQSVIQFAVEVLQVKHIIVCGHYGCGGVRAATINQDLGLIENWLRNIRDVYRIHYDELKLLDDEKEVMEGGGTLRIRRLVELNVAEQCMNVHKLGLVQKARNQDGFPKITGLVYDINDGLLKVLPLDLKAFRRSLQNVYKLYSD